ncbi:hypothetical protein [Nocardia sp. NPDC050710]|uniref:hypothetical protein n=1 Tax=Nocardia sp. NPDC050710 TaxID=3157220 RepID=UPI0034024EC9
MTGAKGADLVEAVVRIAQFLCVLTSIFVIAWLVGQTGPWHQLGQVAPGPRPSHVSGGH